MNQEKSILLYDGSCGFCQHSVQFILQHERGEDIFFAPIQSELANSIYENHPELKNVDSIVFVMGKDILVESDAVLALATYLRAPYHYGKIARFSPKWLRDRVYRIVAKHRHRLIRKNDSCLLPNAQQRKRFLS
ncbi:thiol-disulfide oxidoreductase DCC family protein [Paenisporosarcina indica]|uniref:thiol-disulfide oxidoreductase DCC family protein n=1 Tax=Paenisporosarcina indica TaxID=650093 RepID=UPI0009503367|nr:DCC1-like thiol-disulfide oxidoreductase family protein [Paenisporosarcina indica]